MTLARVIGLVVLGLAACVSFIVLAPDHVSSSSVNDKVSSALAHGASNQASADSAPQQDVVNGWTARDLLAISTRTQGAAAQGSHQATQRETVLLLLAVLAICWIGLTSIRPTIDELALARALKPNPEVAAEEPSGPSIY